MNDGIVIPPAPPPSSKAPAVFETAKVLSLPLDLAAGKIITGEVVSNDQHTLTIKTAQGLIVLEANIKAQQGEKISLRLQNITQQNTQKIIADILSVVGDKTAPAAAPSPATDPVLIHDAKPVTEFAPLQAKLVSLSETLTADTLQLVIKSLLKLPIGTALPPVLQEGLVKFQQLTTLFGQANLLPAQALLPATAQANGQHDLLAALQQFINPPKGENPAILAQPGQSFLQLQNVLPGQSILPDILLQVRQQLMTLLQPAANTGQAPLYTMPALGLVLGLLPQTVSELKNASLVFMATPQGQQLIGLLSAATEQHAALPGTVTITAFAPQLEQVLSLPLLPSALENSAPLRPLNIALGDSWPALEEIFTQALAQQNSQPELLNALRQILPTPNAQQMPPALLFFMAVLKHHMPEQWLGNGTIKAVEKLGKTALIQQLNSDLNLLQTRLDDKAPGDHWQPLPVPLQVGDQLLRLQFFYRHPEQYHAAQNEQEHKKKQRKTRFVLNVPKTQVGDIQIDGLVQDKDLEMILRTELNVTSQMEGAIRSRYQHVLETTGMSGGINFQSGLQHFVRV